MEHNGNPRYGQCCDDVSTLKSLKFFADFMFVCVFTGLEGAPNLWQDQVYELCRLQAQVQSGPVCCKVLLNTKETRVEHREETDYKGETIFDRKQEEIA